MPHRLPSGETTDAGHHRAVHLGGGHGAAAVRLRCRLHRRPGRGVRAPLDPARSSFVAMAAVPAGSPRDRELLTSPRVQTEVYPLATFALGGMMLFVTANDLLVMFVALEVLSLPLYLMCGLARRRRLLSQEASLKYFLLGSFASAFFLYGASLLYGFSGSTSLSDISDAVGNTAGLDPLLLIGTALV